MGSISNIVYYVINYHCAKFGAFTINSTIISPFCWTNENHFVNFTGATFALATYVFTLACIRVVYINKFAARHENLFYRKYSLAKKTTSNE